VTDQSVVLPITAFSRVSSQVINDVTKQKRLQRATALLRRLKIRDMKRVSFTDEKNFSI